MDRRPTKRAAASPRAAEAGRAVGVLSLRPIAASEEETEAAAVVVVEVVAVVLVKSWSTLCCLKERRERERGRICDVTSLSLNVLGRSSFWRVRKSNTPALAFRSDDLDTLSCLMGGRRAGAPWAELLVCIRRCAWLPELELRERRGCV